MTKILGQVGLTLGLIIADIGRPTRCFLFEFEESVDVLPEELVRGLSKMPHLVDVQEPVAKLEGFLKFGGAPSADEGPLFVCVMTAKVALAKWFSDLCLHASPTESEGQFAVGTSW